MPSSSAQNRGSRRAGETTPECRGTGGSPPPVARARPRSTPAATPAERVERIMDMMSTDEWSHRSIREMATKYGVRRQAIERDAAEAVRTLSKLHDGSPEQRLEARAKLLARLHGWRRKALTAKDGRPDMSAIARLEDIEAKVVGAYAPVLVNHQGEFGNSPTVQLIADLIRADPELMPALRQMLLNPPVPTTNEEAKEVIDVDSESVAGRTARADEDPGHAGAGPADGQPGDQVGRGGGAGPAWEDDGG